MSKSSLFFAPDEGYFICSFSNIFRKTRDFENWGILLGHSPVLADMLVVLVKITEIQ